MNYLPTYLLPYNGNLPGALLLTPSAVFKHFSIHIERLMMDSSNN